MLELSDPKILWFLAGLVLILIEFAAPGIIIVFFGLAAWIVSLLIWMGFLESLSAQSLVFGISSLVLLFGLRKYVKNWFVGDSTNESVEDEFIGKTVKVITAITGAGTTGKVELKGAEWNAMSDATLSPGELAKVTDRDGLSLTVKPL